MPFLKDGIWSGSKLKNKNNICVRRNLDIVIIKIERSGGLTGVQITNEVDVKRLPSSVATRLKKMMLNDWYPALLSSQHQWAREIILLYKILIEDGVNKKVIECNEYNIHADLKSIVKFVESFNEEKANFKTIRKKNL